jgi:hypothetical protein
MKQNRRLPLLTLMIIVGAFLFAGTIAHAAAPETLTVDEVWLTGDTLHITVTDAADGTGQTLELNLSDYAKPGDEYVTVQAADADGNTSNAIRFKNPYYAPQAEPEETPAGNGGAEPAETPGGELTESAVPDGTKPFTPDGGGSVIDDATENDGKEFFTVETADGNVFYLIVDRQRDSDNVYLLNAVTENDLASLAKPGDGISESAVPTATPPATVTPEPEATPEPAAPPTPEKSGGNTGTIAFIVIAVIVVGGAGCYFKILRPKKPGAQGADDYGDEPEDDDDFDDGDEFGEDDDREGDGE